MRAYNRAETRQEAREDMTRTLTGSRHNKQYLGICELKEV